MQYIEEHLNKFMTDATIIYRDDYHLLAAVGLRNDSNDGIVV